jgi:hypothetical protein
MLKLYHCREARSLRPLWALEEMGIPYEPILLPFPPRAHAREYLDINPIGTIPFIADGEVRMTESTAICLYLATRYGPTDLTLSPDEKDYPQFLNWLFYSDATLTFPQTIVLRYQHSKYPRTGLSGRRRIMKGGSTAGSRRSSQRWRTGSGCAPAGSRSPTSRLPTHCISQTAWLASAAISGRMFAPTLKGRARGQGSSARALWIRRRRPGARTKLLIQADAGVRPAKR